jgi:hypothetical protein
MGGFKTLPAYTYLQGYLNQHLLKEPTETDLRKPPHGDFPSKNNTDYDFVPRGIKFPVPKTVHSNSFMYSPIG